MRQVEFRPLGRQLPFLGLGCGTLTGRLSLRRSARLVETALDLGIRYFDVAPSYGDGTAEEVLGHVIGDARDVVIATKHGIPRPEYRVAVQALRWFAKPVVDRLLPVKRSLRGLSRPLQPRCATAARHDFTRDCIHRSLETSLRLLKRTRADVYLAHEPCTTDLTSEVAETFKGLVTSGVVGCYGVGIGAMNDWTVPFGDIWQSAWPGNAVHTYKGDATYVFHGALRPLGDTPRSSASLHPLTRIQMVARLAPTSLLLVSASTPKRLTQLVDAAREIL